MAEESSRQSASELNTGKYTEFRYRVNSISDNDLGFFFRYWHEQCGKCYPKCVCDLFQFRQTWFIRADQNLRNTRLWHSSTFCQVALRPFARGHFPLDVRSYCFCRSHGNHASIVYGISKSCQQNRGAVFNPLAVVAAVAGQADSAVQWAMLDLN